MKVLLLDDNESRTEDIEEILHNYGEELITSHSLEDAENKIKNTKYDIVIIDLVVPANYSNRSLSEKAGYELIKCIYEELDYHIPQGVIVVSEKLQDIDYIEELKLYPVSIIDTLNISWKEQLKMVIDNLWNRINPIDLAIITAVDAEFNALYNNSWSKDLQSGSITFFRKTIFTKKGNSLSVILFQSDDKGMVPACAAMSKLFQHYQPKKVAMYGFSAGNPSKTKLGDIIVASKSCDYSSGTIKDNGNDLSFEAEPRQIHISNDIKNIFKGYSRDKDLPYTIRRNVNMPQFRQDINIHLGLMACGPLVVKSKKITEKFILPFNKNYIGIDMETYAVYYMCQNHNCNDFFSIKSVSDFGDANKTHDFQDYCAKLSAELLLYYINEEL